MFGKSVAAWAIARARGMTQGEALAIAASLAQIGEFSFILAGLGVTENVLPAAGRDLVLAVALITIALNPAMFWLADRIAPPRAPAGRLAPAGGPPEPMGEV